MILPLSGSTFISYLSILYNAHQKSDQEIILIYNYVIFSADTYVHSNCFPNEIHCTLDNCNLGFLPDTISFDYFLTC